MGRAPVLMSMLSESDRLRAERRVRTEREEERERKSNSGR